MSEKFFGIPDKAFFAGKVLAVPAAIAVTLGFGNAKGLNSYSDRESSYLQRWTNYNPDAFNFSEDEPVRDVPITLENAHNFLSLDERFAAKGYLTTQAERGNLHLTTRTRGQRIYGVNLVFDAMGEKVIVDNQRGLLNLMRLQEEFKDGDKRLLAFALIVGSENGFEARSSWGEQEATITLDEQENSAKILMWKVYAQGSYPTGTNLLNTVQRSVISEYYSQSEEPLHGKVYRVEVVVDLNYVQAENEAVQEAGREYVGIDWDVPNR